MCNVAEAVGDERWHHRVFRDAARPEGAARDCARHSPPIHEQGRQSAVGQHGGQEQVFPGHGRSFASRGQRINWGALVYGSNMVFRVIASSAG